MPTTMPRSLRKAGAYTLYVTAALLGLMAWPSRRLRPAMAAGATELLDMADRLEPPRAQPAKVRYIL